MIKTSLLGAIALTALGFGLALSPASAAPAAPLGLSALHDSPIVDVRMSRMERHRMMRHRMMRHRMMRRSRRMSPSQSGNAKNPSRPVRMQNQGTTTGGPRY